MAVLADRCINPNCRELIRYEEGTQEILCPWCDHAFLAREFEGEQKKIVEALMAGKQARDALSMERKEKEALQVLLNKSQQAWIDYADVQKHVKEQLRKIEKNTVDIKGDTEELLAGQSEVLREVRESRRVGQESIQQMRDNIEQAQRQDEEAREKMRREFARQHKRDVEEKRHLQNQVDALEKKVNENDAAEQNERSKREFKRRKRIRRTKQMTVFIVPILIVAAGYGMIVKGAPETLIPGCGALLGCMAILMLLLIISYGDLIWQRILKCLVWPCMLLLLYVISLLIVGGIGVFDWVDVTNNFESLLRGLEGVLCCALTGFLVYGCHKLTSWIYENTFE